MKAHIIENDIVINTIEVDSLDFMPNLVEATDGGIGWSYSDGVFAAPVISDEVKAEAARARRNHALSTTDWTQSADSPVDSTAWATYRQALRDIPSQAGFPNTITWPDEPEG